MIIRFDVAHHILIIQYIKIKLTWPVINSIILSLYTVTVVVKGFPNCAYSCFLLFLKYFKLSSFTAPVFAIVHYRHRLALSSLSRISPTLTLISYLLIRPVIINNNPGLRLYAEFLAFLAKSRLRFKEDLFYFFVKDM